jgi:putative transcriptional regulator
MIERGYCSDALRSLHEIAEDLHAVGAIDKASMRRFDVSCLTPAEPLSPEASTKSARKPI